MNTEQFWDFHNNIKSESRSIQHITSNTTKKLIAYFDKPTAVAYQAISQNCIEKAKKKQRKEELEATKKGIDIAINTFNKNEKKLKKCQPLLDSFKRLQTFREEYAIFDSMDPTFIKDQAIYIQNIILDKPAEPPTLPNPILDKKELNLIYETIKYETKKIKLDKKVIVDVLKATTNILFN